MSEDMSKASHGDKPVGVSAILLASHTPSGSLGVLPREIPDVIDGYALRTIYNGIFSCTSDVICTPRSDSNGKAQSQRDGAYHHRILRVSTKDPFRSYDGLRFGGSVQIGGVPYLFQQQPGQRHTVRGLHHESESKQEMVEFMGE